MTGLNHNQVLESRKTYGSNEIPESKPTTFWAEFKETFSDPMIRILIVIASLMIALFVAGKFFPSLGISQNIFEPIGTLIAVFLVATISAKTGVSSDKKYRNLKNRTKKDMCKVLREGKISEIPFDQVVTGDIVLLQSGNKIPADGSLIEGKLSVDNSALNGESEECKKTANPDNKIPEEITGDTFVDESSLFRGTIVFDGEGYLKVQKVGIHTMMGKMALEMNEENVDSPLKIKLSKLAKQISIFGYISAAAIIVLYIAIAIIKTGGFSSFFNSGWQNSVNTFVEAIDLAILIVVCAVPEGLPLMISLVLMQNTSKMLDHNVLIRKAQGIETAGSLSILFSDKTGTITKGHLEVVEVFDGEGNSLKNPENLVQCIEKNTQSKLDAEGKILGGNATDQALMKYVQKIPENFRQNLSQIQIIQNQNFNSANKFSQALLSNGKLVYKGALEKILEKCTQFIDSDGNIQPFSLDKIDSKINEMALKAMRLLAFAFKNSENLVENEIQDQLTLVGICAIRDDVRQEAKEALTQVKNAGIQVVMITGDRLDTAKAIAKDAGLIDSEDDVVLSSAELNALKDEEIKKILHRIKVIARALPTDKSRMIRICQEMNLVCGMTGDGVNDSPALKKADVGFAMGSGTEAAKEAGDIVILDDNFKSIKDAIWYGRTIYNNILKFVKFQLSINIFAVLTTLFAPVLGTITPLTVVMLLFVNLVCDSLGSLMFGGEPALEKYMKQPPRKRDESIISRKTFANILVPSLWMTLAGFILLKTPVLLTFLSINPEETSGKEILQTIFFVFFIWASLFNGFNCRSEGIDLFKGLKQNKNFLKIFSIIVLIQAAIICTGLIPLDVFQNFSRMFNCTPLSLIQWTTAILLSMTVLPAGILNKLIF